MSCAIRFEPAREAAREVRVEPGTTLLAAAESVGLPIARACGADGLCARCGLVILEGAGALSPEGPEELAAKRRNRVDLAERLACLASVHGAVTATARYW